MILTVLTVIVSCGTILFMWLLSSKHRSGWFVSLANQPLWIAIVILSETWGLLILNTAMIVIAIRGLIKWKKNKEDSIG